MVFKMAKTSTLVAPLILLSIHKRSDGQVEGGESGMKVFGGDTGLSQHYYSYP